MKKKILALLLAVLMVSSVVPLHITAAENAAGTPQSSSDYVAMIGEDGYATLYEAVKTATAGQTITLLADADLAFTDNPMYNCVYASVIDLNGKTLTIKEGDLRFSTCTIKNGNIVVDAAVNGNTGNGIFYMFEEHALTLDNVKLTAENISIYSIFSMEGNSDLILQNGTEVIVKDSALSGVIAAVSDGENIIDNSKITVTNLTGRGFLNGNYTVKGTSEITLTGVTKDGFYIGEGDTLNVQDTAKVNITLNADGDDRYGINLAETAIYNKAATATVNATGNAPASDYVATVNGVGYTDIQEAIKAAQNGDTVKLLADVTEAVVSIDKATGVAFTIDGQNHNFTGKFELGIGENLTIQNVNFVASAEISPDYFIDSFDANSNCVLNVLNCTFTDTDYSTAAVGTHHPTSVLIEDCTATGVHSLLQNEGGYNITVKDTTVNGKRGISLGTVIGATVDNVTINAANDKYGIRLNGENANNTITIKNSKISAFIPVVVRKAVVENYSLVLDGTNTMTAANTDGLWCVIGTSEYETNGTMPTVATGKVTVTLNDTGLDKSGVYGAYEETTYVAQVGETKYESLQEAIKAAAPNGTVEVLADVTVDKWIMFAQNLSIGNGNLITLNMDGLTINGNNHTLTINSIESAGNGNYLFSGAKNLNINDLTIKVVNGTGGISLQSGTISNVTFDGGTYGVLPGTGDVTIEKCTFKTNGTSIYFEDDRDDHLVVTKNTFETAEGTYAILLHGDVTFTDNTITTGRVNVVNGSPVVTGNNFGEERFKVYNGATATITGNTINNLVFNDATAAKSSFSDNKLSDDAKAALAAVTPDVAKIGDVSYKTLQAAINAAKSGETIKLLADVTENITIADGANVVLDLNGKTLYGNILVSTGSTAEIKNGSIVNTNASVNAVESTGTLTVTNVDITSARAAVRVEGGMATLTGGTYKTNNATGSTTNTINVSGNSAVTVDGVTVCGPKGTGADAGAAVSSRDSAVVTINGGTFSGGVLSTLSGNTAANIVVKGGTFDQNPSAYLADGYAALLNLDDQYVVGEKPTATVNNLGATTISDYYVYGGSLSGNLPLSFVMQFLADQDAEDMATSPFADWYGDFVLTFTGIENDSFTADGCYLAGYYGDYGWVVIPVDGMTIEDGVRYPVMLGVGMGQKYDYICESVKDFRCALYLTPEILEANPNLQVSLELSVVDNSKGEDAAKEALADTSLKYANVVGNTEYKAEDFVTKTYVAQIGETKYESLQAAINAAQSGETVKLLTDIKLTDADIVMAGSYKVMANVDGKNITLDMNGKKITVEYAGGPHLVAVIRVADGAGLTVTGNGSIDVVGENSINVAYMFWKAGTTGYLTIENGTYHMADTADSMVYTNGHEIVTIKGGKWTLDTVNTRGANDEPWIFNVQGAGDHSIIITGGSFNADINRQKWSNEAVVAKDHYVIVENGYWTVHEGAVAYVHEGMLTGSFYAPKDVGYATFEEALAAAIAKNDSPITLLKNVEVTGNVVIAEGVSLNCGDYAVVLADANATLTAPEGLTVTTNVANGKVVYADGVYKVVTANYVAQIGENKYESLQAAIDEAQSGETITLIADVTEDVTVNKNLTIDGGNFKYTGVMELKNVRVTIQNVNFVKGQINKEKNGTSEKVTIKNCTFDGQGLSGYAINLNATNYIVIENCTAKNYAYGLLQVPSSNDSVSLKNVEISDVAYGIKVDYSNGVTLENVTIKDATVAGILDSNYSAKTITLKNCTIYAANPIAVWERNTTTSDTFKFEGTNDFGTDEFETEMSRYAKLVLGEANSTLKAIEGLNVTTNVDGYKVVYENGVYKLVEKYVAQIGETKYESFADAIAAVQSGETIKLLTNITETTVVIFADVTLDLNGHTLTATYVASFGDIIDSANAGEKSDFIGTDISNLGGGIIAEKDNVVIKSTNSHLPIYDSNNECYRFFEVEIVNLGSKVTGTTIVEGAEVTNAVQYGAAIRFTNVNAYALIRDDAGHGLDIVFDLDIGSATYRFAYDAEAIEEWATKAYTHYTDASKTTNMALTMKVSGLSAFKSDVTAFTMTMNVGTATGADYVSE